MRGRAFRAVVALFVILGLVLPLPRADMLLEPEKAEARYWNHNLAPCEISSIVPVYLCPLCEHTFVSWDTDFWLSFLVQNREAVNAFLKQVTNELAERIRKWGEEAEKRNQFPYL